VSPKPPKTEMWMTTLHNIIYRADNRTAQGIVHTINRIYCTLFASTFRMTPESVILNSDDCFHGAFVTLMPDDW